MKLLLLYPQQTSKPKQRLSQTGAQLRGITQAVRSMLDLCHSATVSVSEYAYDVGHTDVARNAKSDRAALRPTFDDTDIVIDISCRPDHIVQQSDFAGPVIHLSPAFQGSFACNDIAVQGRGRLLQSDVVSCISASREPYVDLMPSTHELDANMHYSAFSPLPARVGDAFYRNLRDHAVVFLSYPEYLRNEDTVNADLRVLAQTLHTLDNLRSLTFICESLADVGIIQQVADALKQSLGLQPNIWGLRKGEYHDMYSIMAKADVVLFGGNALYADAIIRGIPAFPWRSDQAGADIIAETYQDYLEHRDHSLLVADQRKQLDRLFEAQYIDATVPNFRQCFQQVLIDLINRTSFDKNVRLSHNDSTLPEWVIPPAKMSEKRGAPDKVSRSVFNNRQTLLQFKQPPNRPVQRQNERGDRQVFTRIS